MRSWEWKAVRQRGRQGKGCEKWEVKNERRGGKVFSHIFLKLVHAWQCTLQSTFASKIEWYKIHCYSRTLNILY